MVNNISPAVLGVLRSAASVAIFGASLAILSFFADATHLNGVVNDSLAALIAAIASGIEHNMESKGSGALFGAVIPRR